jgi:hypothetical protein
MRGVGAWVYAVVVVSSSARALVVDTPVRGVGHSFAATWRHGVWCDKEQAIGEVNQ